MRRTLELFGVLVHFLVLLRRVVPGSPVCAGQDGDPNGIVQPARQCELGGDRFDGLRPLVPVLAQTGQEQHGAIFYAPHRLQDCGRDRLGEEAVVELRCVFDPFWT